MKQHIARFANDENGAVTVDFVVLTAAITLLGFVVVNAFAPGTTDLGNKIQTALNNVEAE
jgi:Flp pilus assembly pilin Flp